MKVGIIIGSIREGRKGESVGRWVHEVAGDRGDASYELIDLKSFNVPLLTTNVQPGSANRVYDSSQVREWSAAVDACDAFIFVTPEYNHGVPGAFKNAYDSLAPEWVGKPVAFVSYGGAGGVRAVEHWRPVVANFQQFGVRAQVALSTNTEWTDGEFRPHERHLGELEALFDMLVAATKKLRG
ncbi:MAG: NADPH-dependent FMN reductase [Dermatophilaceae bacterium]|nr:NAD(P)H-dependent oxidoreductase [Intrasporangiaceae bacterium]